MKMRRRIKAFFHSEGNRTKKCVIFLGLFSTSLALIALTIYEPPNWQNIAVACASFYLALAALLAIVRGQPLEF
ncbi:MAG: hypothetical protein PHT44_02085 [Candidatus Portnoybacteria bacterium]|nr:hypothetical protein [Candidatus Portnoybacteria bacterium]MDD4982617.1 hypothetical protein [Candidatus Portnoybacteria bacterium]